MNTNTVVDMRKFVEARNGEVFTTTQNVADAFGKLHKDVLRKVESLDCSLQFTERNFTLSEYVDGSGRRLPQWSMTKDGFMFLVMGFTGKAAAAIKEGYIAAFNSMAERLAVSAEALVGDLVGAVIGSSGEVVLDRVIDQKAYSVPRVMQRSFRHTMKSRLRSRFNVQRTALIPAECLADACNFVAAYALEGEFIAREFEQSRADRLSINFPLEALTKRRPDMLTDRGNGRAWLDVSMHDLCSRPQDSSLCEQILCELRDHGYDIEGAWFEVRSLRNRLGELNSFLTGLGVAMQQPTRYSVELEEAA
ncbi:Rha family transcriptional regulator [Pseudomonas maioricensis]|uniref:Rha family transcriptional regulator n=1 Tax=Pseudomonas maioricensis TaxID=1766623 RepID=UPI001FADD190|nr:Rha family transcriptional regulator [Pseudomonas sp. S25]